MAGEDAADSARRMLLETAAIIGSTLAVALAFPSGAEKNLCSDRSVCFAHSGMPHWLHSSYGTTLELAP